ncbi:hypothetical protein POTOM_031921 [Populus tomentosa]|uniref:Uncharacterized protein n=1 Tax=Populus tomentosa TaxID=118781 RepID=A0A8X8CSB8_POPTO|nr:hypothetical protein POTOM_031921 [Populus tomentosa]
MTLQQEQNEKCMIGRQGNVNVSWLATVLALSAPLSKQTIQFFCLIPLPPILSPVHEPHPLLQMGWLQSLLSPLKKLWFRLHSTPKKRRGIYILYEDVKSCQYEDVHVLWSILVESHTPSLPSKH